MSEWGNGFATTQWTLVWNAAKEDPANGRPAFAELFTRYWQPLYYLGRRQGLSPNDTEDALQAFFAELLGDSLLQKAEPTSGRFRTLLNVAWKRFLIDEYRKKSAQKRGGKLQRISLEIDATERDWQHLTTTTTDPDAVFLTAWAESVLRDVRLRLADEYAARGRSEQFAVLIEVVSSPIDQSGYDDLAQQLSSTVGAAKVALHRLRRRYGEMLRSVIAETVSDESEIDSEIEVLLAALR